MIGTLVCYDKTQNRRTVLYAVSGNGKILKLNKDNDDYLSEIVVPSLVSPEKITEALSQYDKEIHILTDKINNLEKGEERNFLIKKRTELTDISLQKVFDLYNFTRFDKKNISLNYIIKKHNGRLPPTGTGDCCAPKLLSYAFENDLQPVSMDEVYYGKNTKTKINGQSYNPCDDRCGYILPYILGVEILYRDKDIIVVNKESGLLSVPGKGPDKQDCVEYRIKKLFPETINQPAVHRLDMETSGILVLALNKASHRLMNRQFAEGIVHKKYIALLDGILHGKQEGRIELKTRVDINNRPYQIIDNENGKLGITDWKKTGVVNYVNSKNGEITKATKIEFTPITGRTHQLRVAASSEYGLNIPIIGDSLYGTKKNGQRLMLHAYYIEFLQPVTNKKIIIKTGCPF